MFTETQWYLLTKDVITAVFTAAGLIIAAMGLVTWKKQIRGVKEFEVGYQLNFALLRLRDAIAMVRHPFISISESREAIEYMQTKYPEETQSSLEKNKNTAVYDRRWELITKASTEAESHLLAGEFLWGEEIKQIVKPLNDKIAELRMALWQNFNDKEFRTKDYMEIHHIIYGRLDGDIEKDKFQAEVKVATEKITTFIKGKIF